jgi:hypothetical protein
MRQKKNTYRDLIEKFRGNEYWEELGIDGRLVSYITGR